MAIYKYLKAFIVFSFTLSSINAFCFINSYSLESEKYLKSVFKAHSATRLIAEDLQLLNVKEHIKSSFDQLTLQIYLSNISGNKNAFLIENINDRNVFFTLFSDHVSLANFLQSLAIFNVYSGDLQLAKKKFEDSLFQFQVIKDEKNIAIMAQNLSWIYFITGDTEIAAKFSEMAIASIQETGNKATFEYLFWKNNMLLALGNANQVESHILNGILARASRNGKIKEWECYYQLGKSYLQQQKMVQAKWFFVQALTLSNGFNSKIPKIKSLLMLAKVKSKVKDYSLAIQDLKVAENLSERNKLFKIDIAKQLADVYKALDNQDKEKYYSSVYIKLRKNYVN